MLFIGWAGDNCSEATGLKARDKMAVTGAHSPLGPRSTSSPLVQNTAKGRPVKRGYCLHVITLQKSPAQVTFATPNVACKVRLFGKRHLETASRLTLSKRTKLCNCRMNSDMVVELG